MDDLTNSMKAPFRLQLEGHMTFDRRHELEGSIIDAMRRHQNLEVDLSAVQEIDVYGVHLLGLLQGVGAVVAVSPAVEEAARHLLGSSCGGNLRQAADHGDARVR